MLCPRLRASCLGLSALLAVCVIAPFASASDWGIGDHYTFRTDAEGWSIVEPGRTHRKIYLSTSEGNDNNSGLSPDAPVASWGRARGLLRQGSSDWILLKRDDTFGGVRFRGELQGESALHPIVVGSYGEGNRPVLTGGIKLWTPGQRNVVFRDMEIRRPSVEGGDALDFLSDDLRNVLVENCLTEGTASRIHGPAGTQDMWQITVRRTAILNSHRTVQVNGLPWGELENRCQGLYANSVEGLLVEECVLDHNGWSDGYETDPDKQSPSMYSHNLYLNTSNRDLTVRGNINARAGSQGLRDGSGQFYVGNAMIQNNVGGYSGDDDGNGNFTTFMDNALIDPARKVAPGVGNGGVGWSMKDVAGSEAIRNIFAHAPEGSTNGGLTSTSGVYVEDYVRYAWNGAADLNPTGAPFPDPERDILSYDAAHGTGDGSLDSFLARAAQQQRDNWDEAFTAQALVRYLQQGFGIWPGERTTPGPVTFTAGGGDQVRWDNSRNWSTSGLPIDGDQVDLAGNDVNYSGTRELAGLHLGDGGSLAVRQGYLSVPDLGWGPTGGSVTVDRAGQFECTNYAGAGRLTMKIEGGRFRNRGEFSGHAQVEISGGEAELAGGFDGATGSMVFESGSMLKVRGAAAEVGYFGDGGAGHLEFLPGSALSFQFSDQGISTITDLYSAGEVFSSLHVQNGETLGAAMLLDLSGLAYLSGQHEYLLIDVDELRGRFTNFLTSGIGPTGVSGARLTWDPLAGEAWLLVDADGTGGLDGFSVETIGLPGDANGDGVVSDADYTVWADYYGQTNATWSMGDFNGNGTVTEADYTIWADHYGSTMQQAVPEPIGLIAIALGAIALPAAKRRAP